jgi:hypothetical protein
VLPRSISFVVFRLFREWTTCVGSSRSLRRRRACSSSKRFCILHGAVRIGWDCSRAYGVNLLSIDLLRGVAPRARVCAYCWRARSHERVSRTYASNGNGGGSMANFDGRTPTFSKAFDLFFSSRGEGVVCYHMAPMSNREKNSMPCSTIISELTKYRQPWTTSEQT